MTTEAQFRQALAKAARRIRGNVVAVSAALVGNVGATGDALVLYGQHGHMDYLFLFAFTLAVAAMRLHILWHWRRLRFGKHA